MTYAASGVDIGAADRAVDAIRDLVASTADHPGVIGTIGGFAGPSMMGWLKDYTGSFETGLLVLGGILLATTALALSLKLVIKTK